jgi:hypothetical protein
LSGGKPPDPHSKEKGGKEGRRGKERSGREERGGEHPQIKFFDYRTEADELSLAVANLHLEMELWGIEN